MKWFLQTIALFLLLSNIVRSYHSSCIIKMKGLGEPVGEEVSDFNLLDRFGRKNMRLKYIKVCTNTDMERLLITGISMVVGSLSNSDNDIVLETLGTLDNDSVKVYC